MSTRARPPALAFEHATDARQQPTLTPISRSNSASSALDPYYFQNHSPSLEHPRTPDAHHPVTAQPATPHRDPATIDRGALHGLGELATPRWTRREKDRRVHEDEDDEADATHDLSVVHEQPGQDVDEEEERDAPDSPWTIEAVDDQRDGDEDSNGSPEQDAPTVDRPLRARRSIADDSGAEEVVYPRAAYASLPPLPRAPGTPTRSPPQPSAVLTPMRPAKKRTSDEYEPVVAAPPKDSARKHRSAGLPATTPVVSREKQRERRRESASVSHTPPTAKHGHGRHPSAGSVASVRAHADYSHLPPSPSSSSIQHFLRHVSSAGQISASPPHSAGLAKDPAHVAHSLLRGTQESSSDLDADALRRLDGLAGKRSSRSSISRPGTPARAGRSDRDSAQWEGVPEKSSSSRRSSAAVPAHAHHHESDDVAKKHQSARLSSSAGFSPKRASGGSAGTPTTTATSSSRDSAILSGATSVTSVSSGTPKRASLSGKRNSAGSDTSSSAPKDDDDVERTGEHTSSVPPVPPLPKDLAPYRSPPSSAHGGHFDLVGAPPKVVQQADVTPPAEDDNAPPKVLTVEAYRQEMSAKFPAFAHVFTDKPAVEPVDSEAEYGRALTTDAEYTSSSSQQITGHIALKRELSTKRNSPPPAPVSSSRRASSPPSTSTRTPSKKWSFSGALGKKSATPASPAPLSGGKGSPRTATFPTSSSQTSVTRRSESRDRSEAWRSLQPDAMGSAASLSSLASSHGQPAFAPARTPDRHLSASRPGTAGEQPSTQGPLSPSGSVRRGASKRLTPSSIPFFRRSSSQSMAPPAAPAHPPHPPPSLSSRSRETLDVGSQQSHGRGGSPSGIDSSVSTPGPIAGASKKSSMLSLGALLKGSSSRRNLADNSQTTDYRSDRAERGTDREGNGHSRRTERETRRDEGEKESRTPRKREGEKDAKERSESRISVLMGRRRGKTVSATDPKKAPPSVALPPMQMSALPPTTTQRLASFSKPGSAASGGSGSSTASTPSRSVSGSAAQGSVASRLTQPTASSLQRQAETAAAAASLQRSSDTSLRTRGSAPLPTIAGSPSVGSISKRGEQGEQGANTKIPRIHSRTSTVTSPALNKSATATARRQSLLVPASRSSSNEPSPMTPASEFGVIDPANASPTKGSTLTARVRASPSSSHASNGSGSLARPRQSATGGSGIPALAPRKNRESLSFAGLRKSSTSSVASVAAASDASHATAATPAAATATPSHSHRFSALSPSKGLKLLSPKARASSTPSRSSVRVRESESASTPSPVSMIDEEEAAGDEEMLQYIKRQQAKKLAHGATQEELDELLRFPEPTPPVTPMNPAAVVKGSQRSQLSEYERQEILDFPAAYFLGGGSAKKDAHPDRPANNFGYDDERGDYLIVNGDHLAYRYEVLDTLGKGSFGQVLSCRDHCTGQMVAIKIIRNKKRFHHQALVEIKILDNLRKWDSEEKHHVIKMTEHFYFRNHLCIAMELLSINLYELIKANSFVGFTTALIRRFTSQMLLSLVLMRHHRIVHCDLKPENVLLRHPAKSAIKVIDFGSSCLEHEKIYTYIQSRFYRSPEVILGMNYHMAIDMWSLGCILAELKTGFPIFPGENEQEQLACIMEVLGVPDKDFVARSSRKRLFFDSTGAPRPVVNSKGRRRRPGTKQLAQVLRTDDDLFVDFIAKCLVWDPERRIKPQAALKHPFVLAGKHTPASSSGIPPATSSRGLATPSGKSASTSTLSSSARKSAAVTETPKKSLISAPAPLSARRTTSSGAPATPASGSQTLNASRSYRASGTAATSSSGYHSSRTLNGFTVR